MSTRSGIVGFLVAGFLATIILPGCGGGSPATGDASAVAVPQSEEDYQKQQEKLRKEISGRNKAGAKGAKK